MSDIAEWAVFDRLVTGVDVTDTADWTWTDRALASATDTTDTADWTESETGITAGIVFVGSFVSSSGLTNAPNPTTTCIVPAPPRIVAGNLLVAFIEAYTGGTVPTITPPSGWTLVTGMTTTSTNGRMSVYTKTATNSEPASYTWTTSVAGANLGCIVQWSGLASGADGGAMAVSNPSATTWASSGFTATSQPDTILVAVFGETSGQPGPGPNPSALLATSDAPAIEAHLTVYGLQGPASTTVPAYTGTYGQGGSQNTVAALALH